MSGSVDLFLPAGLGAEFTVSTFSGAITNELARATLAVESVSASVELILPAGLGAEFSVSTFSGDITNELGPAAEKSSKWTPEKELSFTTGSGGARITVETLSGAIHIRKRP